MRDAILAHRSLLAEGKILHHISINNMMIPITPRDDKYKGFLIDLDLAAHTDDKVEPAIAR